MRAARFGFSLRPWWEAGLCGRRARLWFCCPGGPRWAPPAVCPVLCEARGREGWTRRAFTGETCRNTSIRCSPVSAGWGCVQEATRARSQSAWPWGLGVSGQGRLREEMCPALAVFFLKWR